MLANASEGARTDFPGITNLLLRESADFCGHMLAGDFEHMSTLRFLFPEYEIRFLRMDRSEIRRMRERRHRARAGKTPWTAEFSEKTFDQQCNDTHLI